MQLFQPFKNFTSTIRPDASLYSPVISLIISGEVLNSDLLEESQEDRILLTAVGDS